jgi:hypothetical protein
MSFLYHKRTKSVIKWAWIVIVLVIIASMVLTYSGFARILTS